jgi:hypothetical protein
LNRPFGVVKNGAWKNLSDLEVRDRCLKVSDSIKNLPEYDSLIIETAKNWRARENFLDRHWSDWMLALLVDAMIYTEIARAAEAGLLDDSYDAETLSSMAKLYNHRLQNLDSVREMMVVDLYYKVLQNSDNLGELQERWDRFSSY